MDRLLGSPTVAGRHTVTVATLIDIQEKDRQTVEYLYRRKLLEKQNLLTFADFTGSKEADIEDMFDPDFYLELVNGEYKKGVAKPLAVADLNQNTHVSWFALRSISSSSRFKARASATSGGAVFLRAPEDAGGQAQRRDARSV